MKLRIMSFNILNSGPRKDKNDWITRYPLVEELLKKYNPDIAGFQEVLSDQMEDLKRALSEYQYVAVGRDDGKDKGEFAPIFFKTLNAERSGTFWLSDTPQIPSNSWGDRKRICTWVSVSRPVAFILFNTHLYHARQVKARMKSLSLIISRMQESAGESPAFLIGDLNFNPDSKEYKIVTRYLKDSYREDPRNKKDNLVSFHNFSGRKKGSIFRKWFRETRLDYIFLKGKLSVEQSRIIFDRPGSNPERFPSDHWPILCDISF